ncbi:hypothetical protein Sfulv_29080 [Streptomyces fulvorobeus]|uniref:Uncharacterized protein n=1 Tax=Streptomyces fulvorobeus TaxID=284028 RepID=A0A7J0C7F1_9ACTN|nr:hypothetical protein Sfulv_29080 [Streptomyces fulvorobeus]
MAGFATRRDEQGDPLAVDVTQLHGEAPGQCVVTADDHVSGHGGALGLLREWGHETQHALLLGVRSGRSVIFA